MEEEFNIGSHCAIESCNQLDFLPFKCEDCCGIFCLKHRSKETHVCKKVHNQEVAKSVEIAKYPCTFEKCSITELVPVKCSNCGHQFCLKHRIPEDHNCPSLPERKKKAPGIASIAKPIGIKMKTKFRNSKSEKMAAKLALMKMKMHATGDQSIPEKERVFLSVSIHHSIKSDGAIHSIFISDHWTVGKTNDHIAQKFNITNNNHLSEGTKLKLFSVTSKRAFKFETRISDLIEQEELFNGSSVIIALVANLQDVLQ